MKDITKKFFEVLENNLDRGFESCLKRLEKAKTQQEMALIVKKFEKEYGLS